MSVPKVSVLMPVYNTQENHLKEAIDSILSQTYNDFEFIILDDCSTDTKVEEIIRSYLDKRIIFLKNDVNLGISESRNKLIEISRGEYLAIMDHDDISLPDRFKEQVNFLEKKLDVGLVSCDVKVIGSSPIWKTPENNIESQLLMDCCICHSASMIRKSVLIDYNIKYNGAYTPAEDYALFCDLIGKTKFYNIRKVLFHYRNHKKNTTHLFNDRMGKMAAIIKNETRKKFPDLWELIKTRASKTSRIKLFGVFPLLKVMDDNEVNMNDIISRVRYYLFNYILLFEKKTKL
ncbi:MAG: glycosyltransferase [Holosporaceae bacterium]|jgi:glycosyltransferase involved in cell wall biosynthesis|nr:glycosyltransferase [Holosporaceae bacterium]